MREIIWFDANITFAKESLECFVSREMLKFVICNMGIWDSAFAYHALLKFIMVRLPVIYYVYLVF